MISRHVSAFLILCFSALFAVSCAFAMPPLASPDTIPGKLQRSTAIMLSGQGTFNEDDPASQKIVMCTTFAVGPHLFATAAHCVQSVKPGSVAGAIATYESYRDNKPLIPAVLVASDSAWDIALLGSPLNLPPLSLGSDPVADDPVSYVGHGGKLFAYSMGIVESYAEDTSTHARLIKANMTVIKGSSGAALADSQGRVVGLIVGTTPGAGYAAPVSEIAQLIAVLQ